jgi:hypothetical protein
MYMEGIRVGVSAEAGRQGSDKLSKFIINIKYETIN